jgi:subtilisin family serine protease
MWFATAQKQNPLTNVLGPGITSREEGLSLGLQVHKWKTTIIPGLQSLWEKSLGDPRVTIAILDGPVDLSPPCFNGAKLTLLPTLVAGKATSGVATQHGTHVASMIWGQPDSEVRGMAPACRGLIVPGFTDGPENKLAPCSQIDLARAITPAVEAGAKVINISGGQLTASGESDRLS